MKLLSASAVVTTVALVCWTDSKLDQWEAKQQDMAVNLLSAAAAGTSAYDPLQQWDDLPPSVQQYLSHVVPISTLEQTAAKALSLHQEGEFLIKKDQYVPFTATEVFAVSPPGFSWEGKIAMASFAPYWFPKLFVSDSWVEGSGHFQAAVQAILPMICLDTSGAGGGESVSFDDQMALGQATRWLADAVLLPSSLHPNAGMATWKAVDDDVPGKAILELPLANIRGLQLEVTFDNDSGLLTEATAQKPYLLSNKSDFEIKTWQVNFMDYERQANGMMVPMKMESGWINGEGDFEAHYKIENRSLQYHFGAAQEPIVEIA
ncbi:unnamed protein product [Cylindrotheca closterium]|uniref:DUF945 family protein n=1 Tax=Cylindrotheca closterium TaxID=2856 RepID=A0AAD2CIF5_9STRA|nr:unnamed protein product [Cylindrotheca closterium]